MRLFVDVLCLSQSPLDTIAFLGSSSAIFFLGSIWSFFFRSRDFLIVCSSRWQSVLLTIEMWLLRFAICRKRNSTNVLYMCDGMYAKRNDWTEKKMPMVCKQKPSNIDKNGLLKNRVWNLKINALRWVRFGGGLKREKKHEPRQNI